MFYLTHTPWWLRAVFPPGLLWQGPAAGGRVYLTFDDGPTPAVTDFVLDQMQHYPEALDAYTYFIQRYSSHPKWGDAWFEKSTIEWFNMNRYPEAAQTLLGYVRAAPESATAPEALLTAARIFERDGRFDDAAASWSRIGDEYPTNEFASTALLFAGIMQYRQSDFPAALPNRMDSLHHSLSERSDFSLRHPGQDSASSGG